MCMMISFGEAVVALILGGELKDILKSTFAGVPKLKSGRKKTRLEMSNHKLAHS